MEWGTCGLVESACGRAEHSRVFWAISHAKLIDVRRGATSLADKSGNDGADAVAVAGMQLHAVDSDIVFMNSSHKNDANGVLMMFIRQSEAIARTFFESRS